MKFKISMLFAFIMCFYLNAQENIAQVEFETKLIDYGDIEFNSDGKRVFKFENIGTAPLIFNRISSSCGCTVPKRPKKPIQPGESGEIEVEYDTKRVGIFMKAVTINSNAKTANIILRIKGKVLEEEEEK
ncbi:MAG: DUF1573 domain-containing protein [Flavobacteriaceae bacterium]|tara:strand:- start:7060 stop:7449 length:390 start_codon:yes stop_codon:yes gene_type:complete